MKKDAQKPWWPIVILLLILPPAGLVFLLVRLHHNYDMTRRYGCVLILLGTAALFLCLPAFHNANSAAYHGRSALFSALCVPVLLITLGTVLVCAGLYYLKRDAADRRLIDLICRESILDLTDLSVLLACSPLALRVRLDRLLKDGLLPGIRALRVDDPANAETDFEKPADTLIRNIMQDHEKKFFRRDILWIAAAFLGCFGGIYYYPAALILTAAAWILERKCEPRSCRSILYCACISFGIDLSMLLTIGLSTLVGDPLSESGTIIFLLFFPGILISALHLAAFLRFSARTSLSIRSLALSLPLSPAHSAWEQPVLPHNTAS